MRNKQLNARENLEQMLDAIHQIQLTYTNATEWDF